MTTCSIGLWGCVGASFSKAEFSVNEDKAKSAVHSTWKESESQSPGQRLTVVSISTGQQEAAGDGGWREVIYDLLAHLKSEISFGDDAQ